VSVERVVSGPGLVAIHEYLAAEGRPVPAAVRDAMAREDPAAVIGQLAVSGGDSTCVEALELLLGAYGAEAGNLALKCLATGGVYLAGGIAAKILPCMTDGTFLQNFTRKGRFATILEHVPIYLVQNPQIGLLGAAYLAAAL
jgi:glucokinase